MHLSRLAAWIRNGNGSDITGDSQGGALHIRRDSIVDLNGVWLTDSTTTTQGGGLAVSNYSVVTVRNSQMQDNLVTGGKGGGGVWVGANAELVLEDSIIINNQVDGNGGGGLAFDPNSQGTVTGSIISGNVASTNYGGGIFAIGINTDLSVSNSIVNGNRAALSGGGFYVFQTAAQISNVLITGNYATTTGGGMDFDRAFGTNISNASIVYNQAGAAGGGLAALMDNPTIVDSIIFSNRSGDRVLGSPAIGSDTFSNTATVVSDFNLVESSPDGGSDFNLTALGLTPEFVSGFYLDQAQSLAIDSGSRLAAGSDVEQLTTRTDGVNDTGTIDRGYHYTGQADAAAASVEPIYPIGNLSLSAATPKEFVFRLRAANGDALSSGHEVIAAITAVPPGFDWATATQLEPLGTWSTFADDLGNGIYRLAMDLSLVTPLSVTFDIQVDGVVVESVVLGLDP